MDKIITIAIGIAFIILGISAFVWWRIELKKYYEALIGRMDIREFIEKTPVRPEPDALKIGGIILIAVGITIITLGILVIPHA